VTERIKEIAATRVRYGYRRIHVLLRREGWRVNVKRVCRLYREMGLQLRNKTPSVGSRPSCGKAADRRCERMRSGRWTLCMTNWRPEPGQHRERPGAGHRLQRPASPEARSLRSPARPPRASIALTRCNNRFGRPQEFSSVATVRRGSIWPLVLFLTYVKKRRPSMLYLLDQKGCGHVRSRRLPWQLSGMLAHGG
jgi:hypothetical protein